jgi:hypothetical protein
MKKLHGLLIALLLVAATAEARTWDECVEDCQQEYCFDEEHACRESCEGEETFYEHLQCNRRCGAQYDACQATCADPQSGFCYFWS